MTTYFPWTCPHCKHFHEAEQVDSELGPFLTLLCDACYKPSSHGSLSEEDEQAWEKAINDGW